jgi:molecular chaperone DnaK
MTLDAYGIDFGTTNSVLARAGGTAVETVPLEPLVPAAWAGLGFDRVLPSVIAFNDGALTFGWSARAYAGTRLEAVKRLLATDDVVTVGGRTLRVEVAAAVLLRHISQRAASGPTGSVDRAVITVPANSRGRARLRTKVAAGLAGIDVLSLINEPTAAAMAHARMIGADHRVLVFDWGGGTLDVTVLQAFEGTFIEQASKGVQRLGGLDLDAAFMAAVMPHIPGSADWSTREYSDFRLALELAKIRLSAERTTAAALPAGGSVKLTREFFEQVVQPLIERTREPIEVCLRESPGRIDHLVMVGGSAQIPAVRRFVADLVGTEPNDEVDPMTAVAEGAAIAAGVLIGTVTDVDFHVGTEHALGTITHDDPTRREGEFAVLIGRNTKYPARAEQTFVPAVDFQEAVGIEVVEGDPAKPIDHEDNVILTDWRVALPQRRRRADAAFTVTYEYDVNGILHVLVRDVATGVVLMDEELAFGTTADPAELATLRASVDRLLPRNP